MILYGKMDPVDWEKVRQGKFTASEIHKLMADPKLKADKEAGLLSQGGITYCYIKAAEAFTGRSKAVNAAALEWGTAQEANCFAAYNHKEQIYNVEFFGSQDPTFLGYGDHAGFSPDFMGKEGNPMFGEIKCPEQPENHIWYSTIHTAADLKEVEPQYYWQVQMGLLVTGYPFAHFCSYHPWFEEPYQLHVAEILPVEKDQLRLQDKIAKAIAKKQEIMARFEEIHRQHPAFQRIVEEMQSSQQEVMFAADAPAAEAEPLPEWTEQDENQPGF